MVKLKLYKSDAAHIFERVKPKIMSEGGNSAEQVERNYQLIENLMTRLSKMSAKAEERRKACDEDLNANSAMCSMKVPTLQQDMDERDGEGPIRRKPSIFLRDAGEHGMPELNVTFRSAPSTEAGRRLEAKFDEAVGHLLMTQKRTVKAKAISVASLGRNRRNELQKLDEKKQERVKYERRLQSNLEHYVTRAVNELHYEDAENWPIPLHAQEMNPRLLLSYSCERVALPSGARMFKYFCLSQVSCQLYVVLYWYVHCRFFQDASERQQDHLLRAAAVLYVRLLSLRPLEPHRDFFFKYYPYAVANAIFFGFYYLCPGSRHLYTHSFKKILYLQLVRILTGLDVTPSSVQVQRQQCFPDDATDDDLDNDTDSLPPLPMHSSPDTTTNNDKALRSGPSSGAAATTATTTDVDADSNKAMDAPSNKEEGSSATLQSSHSTSLLASRIKPSDAESGPARALAQSASAPALLRAPRSAVDDYVGSRADLRFRPALPGGVKSVIPRQQKVAFDTTQLSPLLQAYLSKQPQKIKNSARRTAPVHWCYTGGTDTFVKTASSKDVNETLQSTYRETQQALRRDLNELRRNYKGALSQLDQEKARILDGGAVAVGRYALERVVESMQASEAS